MNLNDVYDFALTTFGRPYVWGGNGPLSYDCSGLCMAILRNGGCAPKQDSTAQELYDFYNKNGVPCQPFQGALAFFGRPDRIHHVGWCIDKNIMLNASGGGSHVTTVPLAQRFNASVKIEPIMMRTDFVATLMPQYPTGEIKNG